MTAMRSYEQAFALGVVDKHMRTFFASQPLATASTSDGSEPQSQDMDTCVTKDESSAEMAQKENMNDEESEKETETQSKSSDFILLKKLKFMTKSNTNSHSNSDSNSKSDGSLNAAAVKNHRKWVVHKDPLQLAAAKAKGEQFSTSTEQRKPAAFDKPEIVHVRINKMNGKSDEEVDLSDLGIEEVSYNSYKSDRDSDSTNDKSNDDNDDE